jgi:hypothetical protein
VNRLVKKALICVALFMMICSTVFASDGLLLRLDAENDVQQLPRNFRTFSDLHIAGSAEFSAKSLLAVKQAIAADKLVIVDLRQESHGFVNGSAVSWYGNHNWGNLNKSTSDILADEQGRLNGLLQQKKVVMNKNLIKDKRSGNLIGLETERWNVDSVMTEEQLAQTQGLGYFRITVPDHRRSSDQDVDQFISFVKVLPENTWLYFHCEAGKGRTTTFMVMYDMMKNAKRDSVDEIVARHVAKGGLDLNDIGNDWRAPYAQERQVFLRKFYEYCRSNNDSYTTSWCAWLSNQ